jgi:hypothetical protein
MASAPAFVTNLGIPLFPIAAAFVFVLMVERSFSLSCRRKVDWASPQEGLTR